MILNYNPVDIENQLVDGDEVEKFCILNMRDIKKDTYVISSFGRIFNINTGLELLMTKRSSGYLVANLKTDKNKNRNLYPHRVAANIFNPRTKEDKDNENNYILFIDGDKTNIRVNNMKWVNLKFIRSLANYTKENNRLCTLDVEQVHKICELLESGLQVKQVMEILPFKTSYNVVYNIARGVSWTNVSCLYNITRYGKKKVG